MDPTISIIIPIYNTEKYIEECLQSCINQTYRNFEIIIIDDNSSDGSLDIASKVLKNSKCKYNIIKNDKRSGVSYSRNMGISISKGQYIYFLDSDDIIREDTFEILIEKCTYYKYKLVYGGYSRNLKEFEKHKKSNKFKIYDTSIYSLDKLLYSGLISNALIDSDIIKRNNLIFDESLNFGEDTVFKVELLKYINEVIVVEDILYYWRIVNNSLSSGNMDLKKLIEKEYKLLIKLKTMINKNYSITYNTNLIKMVRIKKNSIYNLFLKLNDSSSIIKSYIRNMKSIHISLSFIIKSKLNKKDKCIEFIYSIFKFLDNYFIWYILFHTKNMLNKINFIKL